jgi:hypothetical protein
MDAIWQWFQQQFDAILAALDPVLAIQVAAITLASMLPPSDPDTIAALQSIPTTLALFLDYISWLDYFVDLRFFIFIMALILSIESSLAILRAWRVVRSLIT